MINRFFYNLSIHGLSFLYQLASVINIKAKKWVDGRKITDEVLEEITVFRVLHPDAKFAWFHCASLGEFEQGRPLIEAFRLAYPEYIILLSFFSPSGYEVRKDYAQADYILYLPVDTPEKARHFVQVIRPEVAFFVKYEFWANFLLELQRSGCHIIGISVIFRPGQAFFKPYGGFFKSVLYRFNHIFLQDQSSAGLLRSIGYTDVTVAGDTRFDRVADIAGSVRSIEIARLFKGDKTTMVIGSAWKEDMEVLIPFINAHREMAFIIAPHEIHTEEITAWQSQISAATIRFSESGNEDKNTDKQVLFIDNVGMLSSLYQYGEYAYIGGAFGKGLHNILEAAVFGVPLFFGNKNYTKFREALDLRAAGSAFPVGDSEALAHDFEQLPVSSGKYRTAAQTSADYISQNVGATARIMTYLRENPRI